MSNGNREFSFDPSERDLLSEILERLNTVKERSKIVQSGALSQNDLIDALSVHPDDPKQHIFMQHPDFETRLHNGYQILCEYIVLKKSED